jgi:23S rRNA (cytosine1962-C5)-methyltransferase
MALVILKAGRDKSLLRRHPWVFSGAVEKMEGNPGPGETVEVRSHDGEFLCRAAFSPSSQIALRVWTFEAGEEVDGQFFRSRLKQAVDFRTPYLRVGEGACRLVNAESDGLPGLIVDTYAGYLVCQFLSAGAEFWSTEIVSHLQELLHPQGIYERSDVEVRLKEGLEPRAGVLQEEQPPPLLGIQERSCRFLVDIRQGQKTGFYLDQAQNRTRFAEYADAAEVLNAFAYTGAFGIHALKAGAGKVTNIEASAAALDLADRNRKLNHIEQGRVEAIQGDVFKILREFRDRGRRFDLIVLDPPKFVESQTRLSRGARGYKDINLLAFKILRPGGVLFTFSCSGLVAPSLFQMIVAGAALDANRNAQMIGVLTQGPDHPTALHFPEGAYLKGLICRVS